jgi:hypothetical protein
LGLSHNVMRDGALRNDHGCDAAAHTNIRRCGAGY